MIMISSNKRWLSLVFLKLVCSCLLVVAMDLPKFPEITAEPSNLQALSLQLAITTGHVAYRKPVDLYVRFVNNGKEPVYIPSGLSMDSGLLAKTSNDGILKSLDLTGDGISMVLFPGEPVVLKIPNYSFPIGKQRFKIKIHIRQSDKKTVELSSNEVEIIVENKPLEAKEKYQYVQYYNQMIDELFSETYEKDEIYRLNIQRNFIIGSPMSVFPLEQCLKRSSTTKDGVCARLRAVEILGIIADKEQTTAVGYIRDTSAAAMVIEQIGKEPDAGVKLALLKIVGKFFDVLNQPQKDKLEKAILAQLAHADAGVRVQAALTLLELFPKQQAAVLAALAKPDFADESARKMMAEALAKAKEKSH